MASCHWTCIPFWICTFDNRSRQMRAVDLIWPWIVCPCFDIHVDIRYAVGFLWGIIFTDRFLVTFDNFSYLFLFTHTQGISELLVSDNTKHIADWISCNLRHAYSDSRPNLKSVLSWFQKKWLHNGSYSVVWSFPSFSRCQELNIMVKQGQF